MLKVFQTGGDLHVVMLTKISPGVGHKSQHSKHQFRFYI